MSKLAQSFAKYVVHAKLEASGIIEKPDVIGAIFGQTEGLLGTDLDLRELQRTGRIGRIEVKLRVKNGKSDGTIMIPSSLDMSETALIASSLETIDKIGPCDAHIVITEVEDVRSQKRRYILERAKEILKSMMSVSGEESREISEQIKEEIRTQEITTYHGLSSGPNIDSYEEIIMVEGRADVITLLKNGIKNVIAIEGSTIPQAIIDLSKEKVVTVFLDGDRGGDLILKRLLNITEIDYVARAPMGKEVEDLTKKEIYKALREKLPADQVKKEFISYPPQQQVIKFIKHSPESAEALKFFKNVLDELVGTKAAYLIDRDLKIIAKVPINELHSAISDFGNVHGIVFDGLVTQPIVDIAIAKKIKYVVGMKMAENIKTNGIRVFDEGSLTQ
ncbi:MAG: DNA primase DnaG [Candidatus Aenigmatarchaeota archaeon]